MDAENTPCAVGISLVAKYEYSNNTLEPSACISGQGGKGEDLYGKGSSSSPHLGSPFELLFDQELLAAGWDLTTRETKLAKTEARPNLDRFSTAEVCNIAMGIFSSLC